MQRSFLKTVLGVVLLIIGALFRVQKGLSAQEKYMFSLEWKKVQSLTEPTKQIIEAEKVFVRTLKALGYNGTFAEQWKQAHTKFGNKDIVFKAHNLRNKIVHETGVSATEKDAHFVLQTYGRILQPLYL